MLVLSMVGFAGIFTGWIFLRLFELLGQVIVLIWMLNQITELKRTPDKQDMEEMLRSHTADLLLDWSIACYRAPEHVPCAYDGGKYGKRGGI